ncbi:ABC transporter permease [Flavitalea sp.]|nr:ABC transporter permease [Flavitalea sp.]
MFKIYFRVGLRNLARNKVLSFINIAGLAIGMAVAILISLWIYDELSFNKYHKNYENIAQVMKHAVYDAEQNDNNHLPYPLTTELKENYKGLFKHIVTARQAEEFDLSAGAVKISKTGQFIDAGAPEMFTLKMVNGNWSALKELNSIIISQSTAKALFGDEDPMGKRLKISNKIAATVTGVYEDLPLNTQFHEVAFFCPFALDLSSNSWISQQGWDNQFLFTYVQINPNTDFEKASAAIKNAEINITSKLDNYKEQAARKPRVYLNPMSKWHLYSEFKNGNRESGPIQFVRLIGTIGAFVLLLACINFINLNTARSEKRAKEVGIRKTIGSRRLQLIIQFFGESLLVVLGAFAISIIIVSLSLPAFNELVSKDINIPWSTEPLTWLWCLAFIIMTSVIAGSYPALYLSSFRPIKVLKGSFKAGPLAALPRKVLVVMQFSISAIIVICTIIVYNQVMFAKNRPVGYNADGLLQIQKRSEDFYGKSDLLRDELMKTGAISSMAESGGKVTGVWQWNGGFTWKGKDAFLDPHFGTLGVTQEYGKTVGWQFIQGRDFSKDLATDSTAFIINETAAKLMGLENPVGEYISWETPWRKLKQYQIIGVIKDMVMDSPYEPIIPTMFRLEKDLSWINLKINPSLSANDALPKIEAVFNKLIPSAPFDYKFADLEYANKFAEEERIAKLTGLFAVIAIFISFLGLFGLASFVAEQRTKEIGVRKILGASVITIWKMLSKDFVILIMISLCIAIPIAYQFMFSWLQGYQYRTGISWWIFILVGLGALLITMLTISFQAIKVAIYNPAYTLRSE